MWFASVAVELNKPLYKNHGKGIVGVDLGIARLATLSDGRMFRNPRALVSAQGKLARLQRRRSKCVKGSNRSYKLRIKIAKVYYRVACIRNYTIHQITSYLTRNYGIIGIESLNVAGMLKNRKLSKALSDAAFRLFRNQLTYKAEETGSVIVAAPVFYASSKLCSACGYKHSLLTLKDREWICPNCGVLHDRDVNAAINLKNMAAKEAVTARGEERVLSSSMKRESSTCIKMQKVG
jgi:putative transposase